jgi:hypothetical protein
MNQKQTREMNSAVCKEKRKEKKAKEANKTIPNTRRKERQTHMVKISHNRHLALKHLPAPGVVHKATLGNDLAREPLARRAVQRPANGCKGAAAETGVVLDKETGTH